MERKKIVINSTNEKTIHTRIISRITNKSYYHIYHVYKFKSLPHHRLDEFYIKFAASQKIKKICRKKIVGILFI